MASDTVNQISSILQTCKLSEAIPGGGEVSALEGSSEVAVGYDDVLDALREVIAWPFLYHEQSEELGLKWPRGCLLHGPPGVGKTLLVKSVAAECGARVFQVTAASIVGAYVGESERRLRAVFEEAEAVARTGTPCIVFVDEVDALCPKRSAVQGHETRIVAQLLTLLDGAASDPKSSGQSARIIAATNRPNAVDPALRRPGRLDREISVPPPSAVQRAHILALHTAALPLAPDVALAELAEACHGYTGADLAAVCREAAMAALSAVAATLRDDGSDDARLAQQLVTWEHFSEALKRVQPSLMRSVGVEPPVVLWDEIGGLQAVKTSLKQAVEWPLQHRDAFHRLGLEPPRGVLLHGPPGCSKTTLARAAATASGANMIPLSASSLYSMYTGDGEALLQQIFKQARLSAPSIIFLDEVEALFGNRGSADRDEPSDVSLQLLSTLLTEMDGMELATGVLVLAATNRPDQIDTALLRPGRFDVLLYVPPPDRAGRLQALQVFTLKMPLADDVDLSALADITDFYTGAELQHICDEAALAFIREQPDGSGQILQRHLMHAVATTKPVLNAQLLEQYESWGKLYAR